MKGYISSKYERIPHASIPITMSVEHKWEVGFSKNFCNNSYHFCQFYTHKAGLRTQAAVKTKESSIPA
jgi:2-iminoacetate synthase ThiH